VPKMILELHDWRKVRPDDDNDLIALFLFSLTTESSRQAGIQLDQEHTFWTEVHLSRDLVARGRWSSLSSRDKIKAMFRWAQEKILERGCKLRQAPMFWTATSPLASGPPWEVASIEFPNAPPVVFETTDEMATSGLGARDGAGLNK